MFSGLFAVQIIHEQTNLAPLGVPFTVDAFLDVNHEEIHRFSLMVRPAGNTEYMEFPMNYLGSYRYNSQIPCEYMKRQTIEYYLLLELPDYNRLTYPSRDAYNTPIQLNVDVPNFKNRDDNVINENSQMEGEFDIISIQPEVVIISPKPGERISRDELFIALSYFQMEGIDPSKIQVYLDDIDVTSQAEIDSTFLSIISESITPGQHSLRVNITNVYGQKYKNIQWNFIVIPSERANIGIVKSHSNQFWASYKRGSYNKSVVNIGEANFRYLIDLDWLKLDVKYTKSSLDNIYDQPYNRYHFIFQSEFMKVLIGDSNPYFDEYSLAGHPVRGMYFEFLKGPLNIKFISGKSAEAVQGDPAKNAMLISQVDSTTSNWIYTLSRNNYTFQQNVFGGNIKLKLGKKIKWDFNFLKVQDNTPTVTSEISNAQIIIPEVLINRMDSESLNYLNSLGSSYYIELSELKTNFQKIFPTDDSLYILTNNFIGSKPRGNLVYGSQIQIGIDDSRITYSTGFSFSLLNQNRWNNIKNVSELDTLAFDSTLDGKYLDYVALDTTKDLSQYQSNFYFGSEMLPMIPYFITPNGSGFSNLLNSTSTNRFSKLQFRYFGHRFEIGSKRNSPDYYSLLNPYLRTNYKESYFSDGVNMFQNKLLLYYKNSKITEGLYEQIVKPLETKKTLFNISLFPGIGLPSFNFSSQTSIKSNNINTLNYVKDSTFFMVHDVAVDTILVDTLDWRVSQLTSQLNISMTNQFQLWGNQVLSVNIMRFNQVDEIAKDPIQSANYFSKNAQSESYGITLKSVYNKHWESSLYFNSNNYNFGNEGNEAYRDQAMRNYFVKLKYRPSRYFREVNYGFTYSTGRGAQYLTQYHYNFGISGYLFEKFKSELQFDYKVKFLGLETKSSNDSFIRMMLTYDIY